MKRLIYSFTALLLIVASQAQGGNITNLFNTGVDAGGTPLGDTSTDTHYVGASNATLFAMRASGGFPIVSGTWVPDDAVSAWISLGGTNTGIPRGYEPVGKSHNFTTFTSPFAGTVTISGQLAVDDLLTDILLNGVSTGNTNIGGYPFWTPFTITGPVTAGVNTLDFINYNSLGPGGMRVEFTSANVPEPSSIILMTFGVAGLFSWIVKGRRKAQ
jgi:hypothetical protein